MHPVYFSNMQRLKPVDVVIAGGGFVGLTLAKEIVSRTPLSVLVLERGEARTLASYSTDMDEVDYSLRYRMMQNLAEETATHRHTPKGSAAPIRQYGPFNPGTGVGGAGEHWTGISYRFYPDVFTLATHLREKHGSKLPEGLAVQDWGVTYDEIENDYWRSEQMIGVGGKAGNLNGQKIEGGNVFEGSRSHEYPNPPHPRPYSGELFARGAAELGYHPYPLPAATLTRTYTNPDGVSRPACVYCGYCTRYGCMIGAKAQPTNTLLPVARRHKNFTLRAGCNVRRVQHKNGHAEGVTYVDAKGTEFFQPAKVVMLASWTLNNSRLLMLSKIGEQYDPATGKGTVGRNLTHQVAQATRYFFDKPLNNFMGAGAMGTSIGDFDGGNGVDQFPGVIRGGNIRIQSPGEGPIASWGQVPPGETQRDWGAEFKKASLRWHDRALIVNSEAEHLAYRDNYLDLDPTYTDKWGDPLTRMTFDWNDQERACGRMLLEVEARIARAMNVKYAPTNAGVLNRYTLGTYQSTHVNGGAIMGKSPENSVVNTWLQHWQMPNLWVAGASAFPQNASGNPTLTVLALTLRAADAFINRYLKHPGALA
jgi:gluconate 2-dehydrogenase alpha chain